MSSHSSSSTTLAPIQPSYTEPAPPDTRHNDEESLSQLSFEDEKETDEKKPYLVHWEPDDQANPLNWSTPYKSWLTFQLSMLALSASLGSSLISPAKHVIMNYTHISAEVAVLPVSFYMLGFAFGPLLWAPLSEVWGRNWSMKPAMFCLGLMTIGTARSTTAASIFVTRFFGGVFGSAPLSNVSAALGDIWAPRARGIAMNIYAGAVLGGPTLGPVIGAALTVNKHLGWRWTEYFDTICVFSVLAMTTCFLPEIYAPVLLKRRAASLRKSTGNSAYWHPHEEVKLDFKSIMTKHLARPLRMLFTEPMVYCIASYGSFVYALLYFTLVVFPIVFYQIRQYSLVISTLPFLGLFVGVLVAFFINLANQPRYARAVDQNGGRPVPEARLPPMLIGGLLFVTGLFWFGWTAAPQFSWALPTVAAAFIGAGFNIVFQQCLNFLVDTYGLYAASAVSANTFLRSLLAAALPLVAKPMFDKLGVGPAMSILGGVACLALPVPLIFMKYGLRLRRMSKFAAIHD